MIARACVCHKRKSRSRQRPALVQPCGLDDKASSPPAPDAGQGDKGETLAGLRRRYCFETVKEMPQITTERQSGRKNGLPNPGIGGATPAEWRKMGAQGSDA
jgi:hypothetical protein